MKRASVAHRGEYLLARGLEGVVAGLPERWAEGIGSRLGGWMHGPLGIRRDVVEANLRIAYPEADAEWIEATARAAYRHLGREAATIFRLSRLDPGAVRERTIVEPRAWAEFQEALGEGRGVILATGHFGNWEIAAASLAARGVRVCAIVKRMGNPLVDARLEGARRGLGVETIGIGDARREVPRVLRRGGVVGIVADQDARRSGVFVPFFGRPASTHRGPALFALRLGSPVFACSAVRLPGDEVRYSIRGSRLPLPATGDSETDQRVLTAALARALEAAVREAPEQYFWFHRRWKTAPRQEPTSPEGVTTGRDPAGADENTESRA